MTKQVNMNASDSLVVLLVEDHQLVRAGLKEVLLQLGGIDSVWEASSGPEALELLDEITPDLIVLDIALPGMNGLQVAEKIVARLPDACIVVLSMYDNEEYVKQALLIGVRGYVLKDGAVSELEIAIRAALRGEPYLSPAVSKHVIAHYLQSGADTGRSSVPLSPRQQQILKMVAQGFTTIHIANDLGISAKTVETHRSHLMQRLDIHDIAGLVRYAVREGLTKLDN